MSIKFRNSEKIYDVEVSIPVWRSIVQLSGEELPTESSGDFDVLNDEETIVDYFEGFDVVYDSGDGYIQFTNDTNTYYDYLVYDSNGYITRAEIATEQIEDAYLYQSGQGKKYKEFSMELYNEDNFPLYKIENGELVETSDEERDAHHVEVLKKQLVSAKQNKITECNTICNQMIVNGVEINGEQFSYNDEDQVNIKEIFDLAVQTNTSMFYHANGESCKLYSVDEIITLYSTATTNKMHHITYFNQLKLFIDSLETIEEVTAVQYGQELTGVYLEIYNSSMAQAQLVLEALLAKRASVVAEEE